MNFVTFDRQQASGQDERSAPNGLSALDKSHHVAMVLSEREVQVLGLLARGYTSEEIGKMLRISTATVNTHRRNMMDRCGCRNSTHLVFNACKAGLI